MAIKYVAEDGTAFSSLKEAKAHDKALSAVNVTRVEYLLVDLSTADIDAALNREDVELADAIERVGLRLRALRVKSGALKRTRKSADKANGTEALAAP